MPGSECAHDLLTSQQILHAYNYSSYFKYAQPISTCNMFKDSEVCDQLRMHQVPITATAAEIYFLHQPLHLLK